MNGKVAGRAAGATSNVNDSNSNQTNRGSDMAPEAQPNARNPRATRKAAMFGKRSNSMRRNAKAEVTKQGWLYKQASSGVKQWNKRWFVLADRCLFYYKDEKEDTVLGSLPLLSFRVGAVQVLDNVTRRFSFKVWQVRAEGDEEGDRDEGASKVPLVFCVQAEHAGTRTYYFSADSPQEQEEWIRAMGDAAQVAAPPAQRPSPESSPPATEPPRPVPTAPETRPEHPPQTLHPPHRDAQLPPHPKVNGTAAAGTPSPSTPRPDREGRASDVRREGGGRAEVQGGGEDDCGPAGGRGPGALPAHLARPGQQSNGWSHEGPPPPNGPARPHVSRQPAPRAPGDPWRPPQGPGGDGAGGPPDPRELQENSVLRRGCLARTDPERLAQRKSSMTQLQRWVNQRRGPAYEELSSPTRYYTVNRGVSADVYGVYGGPPQYGDEYPPLYPPGARPESICSGVSGVGGGYDRRWTPEERRRSLRDGPQAAHYGPPLARDPWGPQYYGGGDPLDPMGAAMKRLSIQPRSRSVPRSPSSSCGGPYSPGPHSFVSPARSPSTCYNPGTPRRLREEALYADPSVYRLRRSLSSPKYDYPGDRRSLNQGLYYYNNYPPSPTIHSKMEEMLELQLQRNLEYLDQQGHPFHDVYSRELHPTLKLNEIETSKLLGRLCEQNRILKDQEAVVHRLRMEKDTLEGALVATHQEMELYHSQPLIMDNLQYKKESLQNQLINIRGELSQASSSLTTLRMEFEALEDEANAIHGDLWEQLNAGGQSELVHRHIQKEFWRVQDVLEGLHKSNSSRGTDTSKHRAASGVSGSYSTTSPASPMSSVGLTSPLSPFSPLPASQPSPTKPPGPEVSSGGPLPACTANPTPPAGPRIDSSIHPDSCRRACPKQRPRSCFDPHLSPRHGSGLKLCSRPRSYREPHLALPDQEYSTSNIPVGMAITDQSEITHTSQEVHRALREPLQRFEPLLEEIAQGPNSRSEKVFNQNIHPVKASSGELPGFLQEASQYSSDYKTCFDYQSYPRQNEPDPQSISPTDPSQQTNGQRKDVYPESQATVLVSHHYNDLSYLASKRRFSDPEEPQLVLFQEHYQANLLATNDCSDVCETSLAYTTFKAGSPKALYKQTQSSHALHQKYSVARPLTYPNNQLIFGTGVEPVFCSLAPQYEIPCDISGQRFMQTHL